MSDIIAGSPAPTNPTAVTGVPELVNAINEIKALAREGGGSRALDLIGAIVKYAEDNSRARALNDAIEAARSEYMTDDTGTDEDAAYNNGVTDTIAAIGRLTDGGESRG